VISTLWCDIREIKTLMEIDPADTGADKIILLLAEWASNWIEEILHRDFSYKQRVQVYRGTGTQRLALRNRPVFPLTGTSNQIAVVVDEGANYGFATGAFTNAGQTSAQPALIFGTDFTLIMDGDDQTTSRSGILIRLNDLWSKPIVRQAGYLSPFITDDTGSIRVTYTAGYTIDTLPGQLRLAANALVARLKYLFPNFMEISSEGYEERSLSYAANRDKYVMSMIYPLILNFRNWHF
jgi:hypothetical protein